MAGRYYQQIHNVKAHVTTLYVVVGILTVLLILVIYGWNNAPKNIRIYIPPDLREGASLQIGEVPESTVYTFTHYIFQRLNTWRTDGKEDYAQNIYELKAFMTPRFQSQIQKDFYKRGSDGELSNRTRQVQEILGRSYAPERVEIQGGGRWVVWLDYEVKETINNFTVKNTYVRYAVKIVRYDIDPKLNPWGLAIDGFAEPARRISDDEIGT